MRAGLARGEPHPQRLGGIDAEVVRLCCYFVYLYLGFGVLVFVGFCVGWKRGMDRSGVCARAFKPYA